MARIHWSVLPTRLLGGRSLLGCSGSGCRLFRNLQILWNGSITFFTTQPMAGPIISFIIFTGSTKRGMLIICWLVRGLIFFGSRFFQNLEKTLGAPASDFSTEEESEAVTRAGRPWRATPSSPAMAKKNQSFEILYIMVSLYLK